MDLKLLRGNEGANPLDINQPEQMTDYIAPFIDRYFVNRHWQRQHSNLTSETTAGIPGAHQKTKRG